MMERLKHWILAQRWRRHLKRDVGIVGDWLLGIKVKDPESCTVCIYTDWARGQGHKLVLPSHGCPHGNGPQRPLPVARLRA